MNVCGAAEAPKEHAGWKVDPPIFVLARILNTRLQSRVYESLHYSEPNSDFKSQQTT